MSPSEEKKKHFIIITLKLEQFPKKMYEFVNVREYSTKEEKYFLHFKSVRGEKSEALLRNNLFSGEVLGTTSK